MVVRRARRVAVVRVERRPARANRLLAQVGEAQQNGHDPAGREGALQRRGSLRGAFTGRPGGVRGLGEQRLVRPARAAFEVRERNVAEVLRVSLAGSLVFYRLEQDRLDPGGGERRGHEEHALGSVEPAREVQIPLRSVLADRGQPARHPGEVDPDDDGLEVLRLPGDRLDRALRRLVEEDRDPARAAFEGVPVVLAPEPGGGHHEPRREHVHEVQVVGDEEPRTGRLRRGGLARRSEHVRGSHSRLLCSRRRFPSTSRT